MATAQVHVPDCDLCGSAKSTVSWVCVVCEENLCRSCRNIHLKGRATRDHVIRQKFTYDAQLSSSFNFDIESYNGVVISVTPAAGKTAWIGMERGSSLTLLDSDGKVTDSNTLTFSYWIASVTDADDDGLYVTLPYDHQVLKISSNFELSKVAYFENLQPRGICMTETGYIVVGIIDDYSVTTNRDSVRLLYKLTKNGIIVETFGHIGPDKNMFTIPRRLKGNINGDIIVLDRTSILSADIVCLDQNGSLRFRYQGIYDTGDQKMPFDATDLTIDPYVGQIIITEQSHKQIHIITKNGDFIQYLRTDVTLDDIPRCIGLNSDRLLWVGYNDRKVATFEYLL